MSSNSGFDQASFLHPRDPSINGWDQRIRFVAPVRKQLFNVLEEEDEIAQPEKDGIRTYLRLKPSSLPSEQSTLTILNEKTVVTNAPKDSVAFKNKISGRVVHQYSFSKVFGPDTSQKDVFDECVSHQIKDFILGSNCLVFAYGTTNAGKTFTIQGNGSAPGLIPRAVDSLFKSIQGQVASVGKYRPDKVEGIIQLDSATLSQELEYKNRILQWNWDKPLEPIKAGFNESPDSSASSESDFISATYREMQKTLSNDSPLDMANDSDVVYGVWISFAEVYNESIFDLLDPILTKNRKRVPLKLAQDGEGNTFVRGLRMIHVSSGDEAFHVMHYGKANLQVAATNMNMRSSRSHCIFTVRLVRYANSDNPSYAIVSSFTFCDLAGAERAKKTLNAGERLKESNNINTSLHVLGRCLATIRENQKKNERKPVPFRDSKLTRIFQRALTGHERITMVVAATTTPVLYDETLNVLKFSAIAKQIVLETPIKKVKPKKKSRFSILASQPQASICWDAPIHDPDVSSSSTVASSDDCVQKYNAQNEELILLVDKLKSQLVEEREKNLSLERDVRVKVTETFSKVISDMENSWKAKLKDIEERNENLSSWRIEQVENFYKQKLANSRKRSRQDSDDEDSVLICDSPEKDGRIQELEEENRLLEEKCSAVHQLLREAQEIQASMSSDVTTLKFQLANANEELEKCKRQLLASEKPEGGSESALCAELQLQLATEKKKLAEELKKNENMRELLNEAKQDMDIVLKEKEEAELEAEKLQNELIVKEEDLSDMSKQLEASRLMYADTREQLNKFEEEHETLSKIHETCERDMTETTSTLKEMESEIKQLQEKLEASVSQKNADSTLIKQLQDETKRLEKDLKSTLQKNIAVEQQLRDTQTELESSQNSSTRLEQDLKSVLQKSSSQLNSSVSSQMNVEDTINFFGKWKEENEELKKELKKAQDEIQSREELFIEKEREVESIQKHRQELINRYEDAHNRLNEELDREKREVIRLRDTLYKSTPTPKKNAEVKRLQDEVGSLRCELASLKMSDEQTSVKKPPRSARKMKSESVSSNESLKENNSEQFSVPVSASKSRKAAGVEREEIPSSSSKMKPTEEPAAEIENEVKPKRKTRRLFNRHMSQQSTDCEDAESIEVDVQRVTTPDSFVRSLRNRKV